jgi:hypothetical protein
MLVSQVFLPRLKAHASDFPFSTNIVPDAALEGILDFCATHEDSNSVDFLLDDAFFSRWRFFYGTEEHIIAGLKDTNWRIRYNSWLISTATMMHLLSRDFDVVIFPGGIAILDAEEEDFEPYLTEEEDDPNDSV